MKLLLLTLIIFFTTVLNAQQEESNEVIITVNDSASLAKVVKKGMKNIDLLKGGRSFSFDSYPANFLETNRGFRNSIVYKHDFKAYNPFVYQKDQYIWELLGTAADMLLTGWGPPR